jgi:methionyl-tRNA formyltransferase
MKIVVLTTETTHHVYFVKELVKVFPIDKVLVEGNKYIPSFETYHPFEKKRDEYEKAVFFNKKDVSFSDVASVMKVGSVNDEDSLAYLKKLKPEIILVFGTGKISPEIIKVCPNGIINLHGGDPEEYRGLDSHLWAIYHKDFAALVTTLHHINEKIDDGNIISREAIRIKPGMRLYELRRYNTELCVALSLSALDMYVRLGYFISRPQQKLGRYYSFMPSELKEMCLTRFKKYTETLR